MAKKKRSSIKRNLATILVVAIVVTIGYFLFTLIYDLRVHFLNRSALHAVEVINPSYSDRFDHFVSDIEQKTNWKVVIISGVRSRKEQMELKRNNPRNASVNKSRHVLGRAIDINLYQRNGLSMRWLKKGDGLSAWRSTGVPEIARKYGLLWGGTYHNYHDPVHFEIN